MSTYPTVLPENKKKYFELFDNNFDWSKPKCLPNSNYFNLNDFKKQQTILTQTHYSQTNTTVQTLKTSQISLP